MIHATITINEGKPELTLIAETAEEGVVVLMYCERVREMLPWKLSSCVPIAAHSQHPTPSAGAKP